MIPGNHDNRINLREVVGDQGTAMLPGFVQYVVDAGPVRLIAHDTNVPGQGGGELCAERLDWLDQRLAEEPMRPTLIAMHHPPFLTGLAALDQIGLANADAFAAVIARHPQVERIVAGHVHSMMLRRFHGTWRSHARPRARSSCPMFGSQSAWWCRSSRLLASFIYGMSIRV